MKKTFIVLLGLIICTGFAFTLDEGGIEVKTGFGYQLIQKSYDDKGVVTDGDPNLEPGIVILPFGVSYGISDGFDVRLSATYLMYNADLNADTPSGISQPLIGVKYLSVLDLGFSIDILLPFGTEDIIGTDPWLSVFFAALYEPTLGPLDLAASVSYRFQLENSTYYKQDSITFSAKPTINLIKKLGISFGADYEYMFDASVDGVKITDSSNYLFIVTPGVNYDISDKVNFELSVPFDIAATNYYTGGFSVLLDLTLSF